MSDRTNLIKGTTSGFGSSAPVRALSLLIALGVSPLVAAQQGDHTEVPIRTNVFKPGKVEASAERIASLKVADGHTIAPFAMSLGHPRIIAVHPDSGDVYVSRRDQGDVILLRDADGDGKADGEPVQVAHRPSAHGLAIHDGKLYIATVREIFAAPIRPDGTLGELDMIVDDLPDGGQHPNRTIAFGPDGMLYASVGSTCNACNETNPEHATVVKMKPDGTSRIVFARGLRNTIGFDWEPATGELWGFDHGIDFLGDEIQPEELNRLELGAMYGWPHIWGKDGENPQSTPPGGLTKAQWKAASTPMVEGYVAHAAPMQMAFYRGNAFEEYRGDAFVAMRGSWNRNPASGYEVVRVDFEDGKPKSVEPFVSGFLTDGGKAHFARPVGLAVAKDGSLLVGDDGNGVIYRIAPKQAGGKGATAMSVSAQAMKRQAARGVGVPIATKRRETGTADIVVTLTSKTIQAGAPIPEKHSEYHDGVSPALSWHSIDGAKSYALIMEDPDAKPITPFVHWVAWNIPASVTSLPEGLHEMERLLEPAGVMQGRTSRNSIGYFGPRPPVGDPPHHYHFQVFALDVASIDLPVGADRDQLLAAIEGHVVAKGELVGTYGQDKSPPK